VKKLIALFVSAGLVLALVLSGCAAPEAEVVEKTVEKTVEKIVEVEKTYQCLNPKGDYIPVELHPLAPRLDSLDGKTILYYESEGARNFMPLLYEKLQADYPTSTFDLIYTNAQGDREPTEEHLTYDACIRGVAW